MNWLPAFRAAYFREWETAGLPDPAEGVEAYERFRSRARLPALLQLPDGSADPALDPEVLRSVYAFGSLVGEFCASVLGVDARLAGPRRHWCGLFNVGISLFDYLSDEAGRPAELSDMPVFSAFETGTNGRPRSTPESDAPGLDGTEAMLSRVADRVLVTLGEDIGPATVTGGDPEGPWGWLQEMYDAQVALAKARTWEDGDLERIERRLTAKSVQPFVLMADHVARAGGVDDLDRRRLARRLGRAMGACFALMDDGVDLWPDARDGRWNLWLVRAARIDPDTVRRRPNPVADVRLVRTLTNGGRVERTVRPAVQGLARVLEDAPERGRASTATVAVALARWAR